MTQVNGQSNGQDRRERLGCRYAVVVTQLLHFGAEFKDGERLWVLKALSALGPHLAHWDPKDVDLEISVKDRDGKEQHVTLPADLPGYSPLVAVAADRNRDLCWVWIRG
jgi:hypothetical protein